MKQERIIGAAKENLHQLESSDIGAILSIPYLCTWDMMDYKGLWDSLSQLSIPTLQEVLVAFKNIWNDPPYESIENKEALLNQICDPRVWSRVILYRKSGRVRGALPAPPLFLQMDVVSDDDDTEADLSGPFPFEYHAPSGLVEDCALAYVNPNRAFDDCRVPTIDLVPLYSVADAQTRSIRYAALLGGDAPPFAIERAKEIHASFVHQMHLVRQKKVEEKGSLKVAGDDSCVDADSIPESGKVWKVFTDSNDPMGLAHPEAGLPRDRFTIVHDAQEADIIYSYQSLFVEGTLRDAWETRTHVLINQFPYEGAFVQKDHLGQEVLKQHGLPRPCWAIETYDLDVQLAEFVGACLLEAARSGDAPPVWIVKPASGTQSQGHVVTRSLGHILRLVDSGGGSRVAQRYIVRSVHLLINVLYVVTSVNDLRLVFLQENPVCYRGRKIDCRCLVMMTSAKNGLPRLYMYNRVYFRIAGKPHSVSFPSDLVDHQSVLTAMHLVDQNEKDIDGSALPIDVKTISQLESDYEAEGFQWESLILPKIKTMICELLTGMTQAYPAMGEKDQYRALYGVDTMFSIESGCVEPKLTEVSFCPANNAMCDAYERNDDDFRNYNTDVFRCLFMGEVSNRITRLQ
jgi:Tubulin-tyrosine ligase family